MKESTWQLIAGISVTVACLAAFYVYAVVPRTETGAQVVAEDVAPYDDPLEMGEYYFNHTPEHTGDQYDLVKARAYYVTAVLEDPHRYHWAWYQLGRIDFIEGKFLDSLYKFDRYNEYAPAGSPSTDYMVGLVYGYKAKESGEAEDWVRAAEHFERFVALVPTEWAPRVDLGWVYFAQGRYEEMVPMIEEGLEHNPDNAWLLNMYGLALLNTASPEAARTQFQLAEVAAAQLTVEDWAKAYPGNDPRLWDDGLAELRQVINTNLALTME